MDSVVVALRNSFRQVLADEISRLPKGEYIARAEVEYALQHLAARLAHIPTINAHRAGREGLGREYINALQQVWGLAVETPTTSEDTEPACPLTGLTVTEVKKDSLRKKEAR